MFNIVYYNLIADQATMKAVAKFSEEEVVEIARRYVENKQLIQNEEFTQRPPSIKYNERKFVWRILFNSDSRLFILSVVDEPERSTYYLLKPLIKKNL